MREAISARPARVGQRRPRAADLPVAERRARRRPPRSSPPFLAPRSRRWRASAPSPASSRTTGTSRRSPSRCRRPSRSRSATRASSCTSGSTCSCTIWRRCHRGPRRSRVALAVTTGRRSSRPTQTSFSEFWRLGQQGLRQAMAATPVRRMRVVDVDEADQVIAYALTGRAGPTGYLQRLAVRPRTKARASVARSRSTACTGYGAIARRASSSTPRSRTSEPSTST